jgi:hypothetical protein
MRLGCIGLLVGVTLTWGGGQSVYEAWNSGQRRDVTLAQFLQEKPEVGWFRITDAEWNLIDGSLIVREGTNSATGDLYIPVHAKGVVPQETDKIEVLLHRTSDADAAKLTTLMDTQDEATAAAMLEQDKSFLAPNPVEGMIEFGINSDGNDTEALQQGLGGRLADDYVVLTDGAEPPGYGLNFLALLAGLLILGYMVYGVIRDAGANEAVDE